jgi:hypothetical protein
MEEALAKHGHTLKHVIGPGMGHKYHPDSAKEVEATVHSALNKGRDRAPLKVHLQTQTLRYNRMHWIEATRISKHWIDCRIDAERNSAGNVVKIRPYNVTALTVYRPWKLDEKAIRFEIAGQSFPVTNRPPFHLVLEKGEWKLGKPTDDQHKSPGLQGPIDDAFLTPFLVALPSAEPKSELHARWLKFEVAHFQKRWKELFRGELRTKREDQLTPEDHANYNIIAWGTTDSSPLVKSVIKDAPRYDPKTQVVAMIRPNPNNPNKYLVINSGPTFREAHDRTNSLQNPKLGDWAVIDLRTDPNAEAPGKIISSGFFSENWR